MISHSFVNKKTYSMTDPNMYVISLDAIDLNYISASLDRGNGKVMPIWAKRNLNRRNDEFFEFKIEYSDSQDELDTEMGNTLCHICDIDIPTSFLNEHYESFKHKINVKIINTALDRIKRSIDNSTTDVKKNTKLHFCPSCVTVVKKEEKESHVKSFSHKNSVVVEKFLYDFYLLYANEEPKFNFDDAESFEEDSRRDFKKNFEEEPRISHVEEIVELKVTNNNYLPPNKINGNTETSDVKSVDITKAEIKKDKEEKIKKKENENSAQVSDTIAPSKKKKKKKAKLNVAAGSSGDIEVLPDAEDSIVEHGEDNEYIKYIHHLQETLFNLNCKVCKLNIDDVKEKKIHLESVSHYQNYLEFLSENMMMETADQGKVECVACGQVLNRKEEVEHCIKIKHITNLEIWIKQFG